MVVFPPGGVFLAPLGGGGYMMPLPGVGDDFLLVESSSWFGKFIVLFVCDCYTFSLLFLFLLVRSSDRESRMFYNVCN